MTIRYNRRTFLRYGLAGMTLAAAPGCSILNAVSRPGRGSVRLVFFSDVHARTEWDTPIALGMAADAINAQKPDLVIAGGDLITDGFQSSAASVAPRWDAYMEMHNAIKGEVHAVIGNHDLVAAIPEDGTPPADDPRAVFRERLGVDRTYYSFDALGYHFILADSMKVTHDELKYNGMIGPEQLEWLKEDLSKVSRDQPIVLAMHIPLVTTFYQATEGATFPAPANRVVVNNVEVLDVFRHHNLLLVLQGHLHVSEMLRLRGTTFVTGGAICGKWWRGPWKGTPEGFTVLTLRGNSVEWEYVSLGWHARRPAHV